MNLSDDIYKLLYEVQNKCHELNQKIDSIIRLMEMYSTYMQYSSMMPNFNLDPFVQSMPKESDSMNPKDFQKMMNAAKQSDQQMTPEEFNQLFETLKQGKSPEEAAKMDQMVQLARSFMK